MGTKASVKRGRSIAINTGLAVASTLFAVAGVIEGIQGRTAFTAMFITIAAACSGASTATRERGKHDGDKQRSEAH